MAVAAASLTAERDYQVEAIDEARHEVARHGSTVVVAPTGSGKTVIAGGITRRGIAKGSTTLLLVHRRELVAQSVATLAEACPDVPVGVIASGWPATPWAPLQVATVQTLACRESPLLFEPTIIIIDEAHHVRAKTWEKVLARWPNAALIGLTATPERLDGKGLGAHFASMVLGPTIEELATTINPATGITYLAPTVTLTIPVGLDLSKVRRTKRGEYRADDQADQLDKKLVVNAADAYMTHAAGRSAIFFGVHREHSRQVCAELRRRDIRAEHVDGDDHPSRRDRIMREFRDGRIEVVGNCDLISEGFDAPACEVVMMGARTASVTRYLQMAGRAMRPAADKIAMVLDLMGSSHELGLPDEPREWSLEDGCIGRKRSGDARPKVCDQCFVTFYGRKCPSCQHEAPMVEVEEVEVQLERATRRSGPPKRSRRQNMDAVREAMRTADPLAELRRVAREAGYKPSWAHRMLEVAQMYGWDRPGER